MHLPAVFQPLNPHKPATLWVYAPVRMDNLVNWKGSSNFYLMHGHSLLSAPIAVNLRSDYALPILGLSAMFVVLLGSFRAVARSASYGQDIWRG